VRNLTITNDEAYGIGVNGKARRSTKDQQPKLDQIFRYSAVTDHRDVNQKREYRVLWEDGSLTWEPGSAFQEDARRAEGNENVVTKYLEKILQAAKPNKQKATRKSTTWTYQSIVDHKDDERGERSYYVAWDDGSFTWEPAAQFKQDVERAEGLEKNVVLDYEKRRQPVTGAAVPSADSRSIEHAKEFATWVEQTVALELTNADRSRADERLALAPRVPALLPWSVRSPLTAAAGRMKMHDYLLYARHWAPLHLRGFFNDNVFSILLSYFHLISRLTARTIRLSEVNQLRIVVGEVLSQLELILPATEFTILVHVLVHVPAQLAWFGPARTTWMFAFERWC
jgi:hypothetical protein